MTGAAYGPSNLGGRGHKIDSRNWRKLKLSMALTPSVTSNIVPGSHFSPPLLSPCLVLPPRSSTVPSRLTCRYLITPFSRSLFLIVICFYASCSRCSDSSDTDAGRFFISFPNFLPIKMSPMSGLFIFGLFLV